MSHSTSIVLKYLQGRANPEEAALIDTWRTASQDNMDSFDRLWQLWQLTNGTPHISPSTKGAWQELVVNMQQTVVVHRGRYFSSSMRRNLFIAAGAAFTALLVFIFWPADRSTTIVVQHQSRANYLRDTIYKEYVAVMDTYCSLGYAPVQKDGLAVTLNGGIFLEPLATRNKALVIELGSLTLRPDKDTRFYVHKDSLTNDVEAASFEGNILLGDGLKQVQLKAGEAVVYNSRDHLFGNRHAANINRFSFATKVFYFNDTPLKEAMGYLSKAYGIPINISGTALAGCRITTRFDNKDIEYIMDIMSATLHFNYEFSSQKKSIYISGEGCN